MEVRECQGKTLRYLAIEPDDYAPGRRYPMVVLLHGFGAHMGDLATLCPLIDQQGYIYVCPNAPLPVALGFGMTGYAWVPPRGSGTPEDAQRAEEALATLVDEVMRSYDVEPGQLALGGFSQGGMMTYRLGLPSPEVFRGLFVLSSWLPDQDRMRERLPATRTQPIFIAHGTRDELIAPAEARKAVQFLESEGYEPQFREYPMGHQITQQEIDDLAAWLKAVLPTAWASPRA